mmetsp:Transcript_26683/g.31339  ORF Transcript_26683/g.31339 Transcript_26683/m.31339 type:complete len:133 (-) Transcript_26683:197-595(-)
MTVDGTGALVTANALACCVIGIDESPLPAVPSHYHGSYAHQPSYDHAPSHPSYNSQPTATLPAPAYRHPEQHDRSRHGYGSEPHDHFENSDYFGGSKTFGSMKMGSFMNKPAPRYRPRYSSSSSRYPSHAHF